MKARWHDTNYWHYGETALDLLKQLKTEDWSAPNSVMDFKLNVARRVQVMGTTLLFWDATSFLLGMEKAGFIHLEFDIEISEDKFSSKNKKKSDF